MFKRKKQLRAELRKIVRNTPFHNQHKVETVELIVLRALELIRSYQRRAWSMDAQVVSKSRGRPSQNSHRSLLTQAIIRAWRVGQDEKPIVNKRLPGAIPSPFVQFATKIYHLLHIQNVIDNLDAYRSLGNRLEKDGFTQTVS